jgi:hypothetical protein
MRRTGRQGAYPLPQAKQECTVQGLQYIAMPVVPMEHLVELSLQNLLQGFRPAP